MSLPFSWILGIEEWMLFDHFLQGVIGACGISVLCNLMRVQLFTQTCSNDSKSETETQKQGSSSPVGKPVGGRWSTSVRFWCLAALLSLVGPGVSSLIVLEFSLRTVSAWVSAGPEGVATQSQLFLIQCQFSLGCALTCTLHFLQQGAPYSSLSLLLAVGLSWALAGICHRLWIHVATLYPLHSTGRYCGKCITLHTSGNYILVSLQKMVVLTFGIASVACLATVYHRFLSQEGALKFWTPLTLCYAMLVVYVQEDQHRHPGGEAISHSVALRLGALLVLMLTLGHWSDILHVLITFLGEIVCLVPSQDLLRALIKKEDRSPSKYEQDSSSRRHMSQGSSPTIPILQTESTSTLS